jgi:phospholipase/lecithinase/hemolysin
MRAFDRQDEAVHHEFTRTHSTAIARLIVTLVICFAVGPFVRPASAAGPYSQLIVFGDSLSDIGNVAQATEELSFIAPRTPGPYYYNGRFSNGPAYTELLASSLGLTPFTHSRSGGTNYAHGGAKTSGTSFPNNLVVRDVDDQVSDFLAGPAADPNALYLVFAGSNDLIDGQTNVSVPVNRLATDIGRLVADGARNFLVLNLPLLGYTPRYNDEPTDFTTFNMRSQQFNTSLATMLDGIESSNPGVDLFRFDVAGLFGDAIANPHWFGFANVTDSAAPGLEPGDSSYNTSLIAPNANQYVFWDDLHPTSTVHAILAERLLLQLSTPGDFNRDDVVDAADYVAWRKKSGVFYTPSDSDTWRSNFGESSTSGSGEFSGSTVPEPAVWLLLTTAIALACGQKSRSRLQ